MSTETDNDKVRLVIRNCDGQAVFVSHPDHLPIVEVVQRRLSLDRNGHSEIVPEKEGLRIKREARL